MPYVSAIEGIRCITVSQMDADVRMIKNKDRFSMSYNLKIATDSATHLIGDSKMTNRVSDYDVLNQTIGGILEVTADKG